MLSRRASPPLKNLERIFLGKNFLINISSKLTTKQAYQKNRHAPDKQEQDIEYIMFKEWEPINS